MELLRKQNSDSSAIRWRKLWHTNIPSIQGVWTPFTHRDPAYNLVQFPSDALREPIEWPKSATEALLEIFEEQKLKETNSKE